MALAGFFLQKKAAGATCPFTQIHAKIRTKRSKTSTPQYNLKAGTWTSLYIKLQFTLHQTPKQRSRFTPDVEQDEEFFVTKKPVLERPVAFAEVENGSAFLLPGNTRTGSEFTHKILIKFSTPTEKKNLIFLRSYSMHHSPS